MRREPRRGLAPARSAHARSVGLVEQLLTRVKVLVKKRAAVGDSGMRQCISRVELDCPLEHLPREFVGPFAMLMKILAASQIEFVGFDVGRLHLLDRFLFVLAEHDTKRGDDALRDLILNRKNVLQLAVVTLAQSCDLSVAFKLGRSRSRFPLRHFPRGLCNLEARRSPMSSFFP